LAINSSLKLVLVPWGADSYGDDVWLLENALLLGLETIFEKLDVSYADLCDQLGSASKRTSTVIPFQEPDLLTLAGRAPEGTSAIIDGLITIVRDQETSAVRAVEIAPRLLQLPSLEFHLPDAFRFEAFFEASSKQASFEIDDQDAWHSLVLMAAGAILEPFEINVFAAVTPPDLQMSSSWGAYSLFIKGKRGAKTLEEKLGYYRQASRIDPKFFWAHYNAGQLLKQQQDYHSARREFLAAADAAKDDNNQLSDTLFELGLCSIFLGDSKTARNFWDQALVHTPNNPTLLVNIAGTYEQEEDWQNAMRLHQAALDANPNYYKALVSLARLKAQVGEIEEAIPLYETALAMEPNDPMRHAILGGCYLAQGDEVKARQYFQSASDLDPAGGRRKIVIDEAEAPPPPGEYARQELSKLDEAEAKRQKGKSGGWRWFGK
jgi:tetratricopeptide (TPR) repeat protein